MRQLKILALGMVGLVLVVTLELWAKWMALGMASVPLLLLIAGQFCLPKSRQSIQLWLGPDMAPRTPNVTLQLEGRNISVDFFRRSHNFQIEVRNWGLLGMLAILSLAAVGLVWRAKDLRIPGSAYYYGCILWLPVCSLAGRWLKERLVMRNSRSSLSRFRVNPVNFLWKRVTYTFTDGEGHQWGDSFLTLFAGESANNLSLAFYEPGNPQRSVIASAMTFHRLKWA